MELDLLSLPEILILLLLAVGINFIGWRYSLFSFPKGLSWKPTYNLSAFVITICVFFFFFASTYFFANPIYYQLFAIICYFIYLMTVGRPIFKAIWKSRMPPTSSFFKDIQIALFYFLCLIPFVSFLQNGLQYILTNVFSIDVHLQDAVSLIQNYKNQPIILAFLFIMIVIIAPILEEFIFRGNLQNFLKKFMNNKWAVISASLIFAFCHIGTVKGIGGQITTLIPLFIASLYIGFAYERQQSLIAPIKVHCLLNLLSFFTALLS